MWEWGDMPRKSPMTDADAAVTRTTGRGVLLCNKFYICWIFIFFVIFREIHKFEIPPKSHISTASC